MGPIIDLVLLLSVYSACCTLVYLILERYISRVEDAVWNLQSNLLKLVIRLRNEADTARNGKR